MNRIFLLLILQLTVFVTVHAQYRYKRNTHYLEAGIMLGGTQYSGDLAESDWEVSETKFGFGGFVRYHIFKDVMVRGQLYAGYIAGDDKNSPDLKERKFRFFSPIYEGSLVMEYVPFALEHVTKTGMHNAYFSPFIFGGVGYTAATRIEVEYYGPEDQADKWIKEPFPEQGLSKKNFLTVPFGFGMRFDYFERFTFGLEIGWRPAFSDDLDGVSVNGNPELNDWYHFFGLTASYFINQPWKPLP